MRTTHEAITMPMIPPTDSPGLGLNSTRTVRYITSWQASGKRSGKARNMR